MQIPLIGNENTNIFFCSRLDISFIFLWKIIKFLELDNGAGPAGKKGPKEVRVGVVAVFDGHIGQEASEMASKLLLDYFYLHSVFGLFKDRLKQEDDMVSQNTNEEPEQHKSTLGR